MLWDLITAINLSNNYIAHKGYEDFKPSWCNNKV
jgi:hypothetical protein